MSVIEPLSKLKEGGIDWLIQPIIDDTEAESVYTVANA